MGVYCCSVCRNKVPIGNWCCNPRPPARDWTIEKPPMIMRPFEPYTSIATGKRINSREDHKNMLRDHDLIEVGNEIDYMEREKAKKDRQPLVKAEDIKEAIDQLESGYAPPKPEHAGQIENIFNGLGD